MEGLIVNIDKKLTLFTKIIVPKSAIKSVIDDWTTTIFKNILTINVRVNNFKSKVQDLKK